MDVGPAERGDVVGLTALPVGETGYFDAGVYPSQRGSVIDVRSLTAVITADTSHAKVRVLLCRAATEVVGAVTDIRHSCSSASTFRPGRYQLTPGPLGTTTPGSAQRADVIVAVTPTRSGRVYIAGLRIRYVDGIRRGDQQTGVEMFARTPRS